MAEKDKIQKTLESYNDVFADIVNVLLFNGEQIVKENDLTDAQTFSYYKMDTKNIHSQERDVAKIWNNGEIRISFIGLENQMKPFKFMPFRVIGYDGAAYRNQLNEKLREKGYPVVTLVLYFGTKRRWKNYKSLKEIIEIPKALDSFINDYRINVFELAWLSDEQINSFTSDFRYVAILLRRLRTGKPYPLDNVSYRHAREILDLFYVMSQNNRDFESFFEEDSKNGNIFTGRTDLNKLIQSFIIEGAEQKAIEDAKSFYANGASIELISKSLKMTPEQVKEIVKDVVVLQS